MCSVDFYPVQQLLVPIIMTVNAEQAASIAVDETSWQYSEYAMTPLSIRARPWDPFEAAELSSFENWAAGAVDAVEGVWLDHMLKETRDSTSWWWSVFAEALGESEASRRRVRWDASSGRWRKMGHYKVPRNIDLRRQYAGDGPEAEPITTLMIRNVPNRYSQELLVTELKELGFRDSFDFVYLPIDRITHWNVGYAFVNLLDAETATRCAEKLQGYTFKRHQHRFGKKVLGKKAVVSNAHLQGLHKNVEHYRLSWVQSLASEGRRPRFFNAPWCGEFGARPLNKMD